MRKIPQWYHQQEIRNWLKRDGYPTSLDGLTVFLEKHLQLAFEKGWMKAIAASQPDVQADAEIRGMCPVCGRALVMGVCETGCGKEQEAIEFIRLHEPPVRPHRLILS